MRQRTDVNRRGFLAAIGVGALAALGVRKAEAAPPITNGYSARIGVNNPPSAVTTTNSASSTLIDYRQPNRVVISANGEGADALDCLADARKAWDAAA